MNKPIVPMATTRATSEDITQNNMIKGFRMPEKVVAKVSPPPRRRSNSKSNSSSFTRNKAKINTILDEQKLKKVSHLNSKISSQLNSKTAQDSTQLKSRNSQQRVNYLNRLSE
jgi:hypothetical protein